MTRRDEWAKTRLKHIADCNRHALPEDTDPDLHFAYVDIGNVQQGRMTVDSEPIRFADAPSRARRLATPGDTVVSTVRTYLRAVATVPESEEPLVFSTGFAVLHPRPEVDSAFLAYYLQGDEFVDRVVASSTGVSYPAITATDLMRLDVRLPGIPEQRAIVAHLDHETSKIDALIAEQVGLVEVLRERRTALIFRAITRGIDRCQSHVDVGGWMNTIPSHWEAVAIKRLTPVNRGASPRPIEDPIYFDDDGEWAWVRIADVTAAGPQGRLQETTQTLSEIGSALSVKLEPGALFVSIAGTVGKPCITDIRCCIHDGFVYFPRLRIDPRWLFRVFESGECYKGLGKLGTQLNLNTDTIGDIKIPMPPQHEIEPILAYLDEQTSKIDALITEAEGMVVVAKERRAALITAAVTGQIDVRGEVA